MSRLGWLLVAMLALAGVVAACGGGAPEREVGSQRPEEQEPISQDDAADDLADALEANDDRGAAQGGTEVEARMIEVPLTREAAQQAAEARSSNDAAGTGLGAGSQPPDGAIRINVFPLAGSLTAQGPVALGPYPRPLPLQLSAGPWNCAVGVDHPASDEAEGRFVVTFADFDETGSEMVVEPAGPEWSGEARLEVVESEDEDKTTTTRAIPGIVGSMSGRRLTATIESGLQDGTWMISCRRINE